MLNRRLRQNKKISPSPVVTISPTVIQKPRMLWINGRPSKFIPKKPVTRLSGMKTAVITVSVRMMLLARLLCMEK